MSTNKNLELYKQLYSEYVATRVDLHNYHTVFVNNVGLESCRGVRNSIIAMAKLEKQLRLVAWDAHKEQLEIDKAWRKSHKKQKTRNIDGLNSRNKTKDVDIPK